MQLLARLAPRDINRDIDKTNIISSSRRRQPKRDNAYSDNLPELPRN
ncbi:hypothetical protein PENANT_c128G02039, partial [Penicillium antarcticum]